MKDEVARMPKRGIQHGIHFFLIVCFFAHFFLGGGGGGGSLNCHLFCPRRVLVMGVQNAFQKYIWYSGFSIIGK